MSELPEERAAVHRAVSTLQLETFLYEMHAHASHRPPKQQWESELTTSQACIVILYRKLGPYTVDEIEFAQAAKIPILLYRKIDAERILEAENADYLQTLENVDSGLSARYFEDASKLEEIVVPDLMSFIKERVETANAYDRGALAGARRQGEPGTDGVEVREAARPGVFARDTASVRRVVEPPNPLVGRGEDAEAVVESIEAGERLIAITGPYGIGRKALVRHLGRDDASAIADRFPDGTGVSPIDPGTTESEDVLQSLWELFYELEEGADPVTLVDPTKRQGDLEKPKALVVMEDAQLSESDLEQVSRQMRESVLIVTTDQDWYGEEVQLDGLEVVEDMVALFQKVYRAKEPISPSEPLAALFGRVGGSPFLVEALARRARKDIGKQADRAALDEWATLMLRSEEERFRTAFVRDDQRSAFDAVRAAGTVVPLAVMELTPGGDSVLSALEDGVVEAASPRVRVNPALAAVAGSPQDDDELLADMFDAALDWAGQISNEEAFENREFVLRMLEWGLQAERFPEVIELARRTEQGVAVGGRHGAWRRTLESALQAARRTEPPDIASEAWAAHQLGSMALLRDELDDARELLHDALEKREAIGDTGGAEVSRRNLNLVPMAIVSVATLVLMLVGLAGWIMATARAEAWVTPLPEFTLEVVPTPTAPGGLAEMTMTIGNLGDLPLSVNEITVDGSSVVPRDCPAVFDLGVDARRDCEIQVEVAGDPGDRVELEVEVVVEDAEGHPGSLSSTVAVRITAPGTPSEGGTTSGDPDLASPGQTAGSASETTGPTVLPNTVTTLDPAVPPVVPAGVLRVVVDVTTEPGFQTFAISTADETPQLVGEESPPTAWRVSGTPGVLTIFLPDDWTLVSVICSGGAGTVLPDIEKAGTAGQGRLIDVSVPITPGDEMTCSFEIAGQAIIDIEPNVLRFPQSEFTIRNEGTAQVEVPPISPDPASDFVVVEDGCSGVMLAPDDECAATVTAGDGASVGVIEFPFADGVSGDTRILLVTR